MPRDSPMQGGLRRRPGMEAVELMMMDSEYHELAVLRARCWIAPNAAKAAVKVDHGKISERRRRHAEAESQYAKCTIPGPRWVGAYATTFVTPSCGSSCGGAEGPKGKEPRPNVEALKAERVMTMFRWACQDNSPDVLRFPNPGNKPKRELGACPDGAHAGLRGLLGVRPAQIRSARPFPGLRAFAYFCSGLIADPPIGF
jgi:hypothetical protein